jgi:dTDP-glucose 4,6-dehydratase
LSRLLVTGGAGFIGSNFVKRTLELNPSYEIVVLDALTYAGNLENLSEVESKISFVQGNIADRDLVRDLVSQSEIVVNFAAESHNDNSLNNPEPFIRSNIQGTFELLEASREYKKRFHQISTDEVYGDLPLHSREKFKPGSPYKPSSPYSASKAAADHLVNAWVRSFGVAATISNCSNNFGPNQHPEKLIPRTALLAASGIKPKVYGNGLNVRDWIHVDDHTDGVLRILEKGQPGDTYLLGANSERTNLQVVTEILSILGKPSDFIEFVSDRPGHDLRYAIDASETTQKLGWQPKAGTFEELLPAVVRSYLEKSIGVDQLSNSGLSVTASEGESQ